MSLHPMRLDEAPAVAQLLALAMADDADDVARREAVTARRRWVESSASG